MNSMSYTSPFNFDTRGRMRLASVDSETELLLFSSNASQTSNQWQLNTFYLINKADASIIGGGPYGLGDVIPEIHKAVIKADERDPKVLLTNFTIGNGSTSFVPSFYCDSPVFYFANFTEKSTGIKVIQSYSNQDVNQKELNNRTRFYLLLFDDICNGGSSMTRALVDDDTNFNTDWVDGNAWDFDHAEYKSNSSLTNDGSESWIGIGEAFSWPFKITSVNYTSGVVGLFAAKQGSLSNNENASIWISASILTVPMSME